jgi:lipoprotein-anchoring transpeptidase ErfK/SrfK
MSQLGRHHRRALVPVFIATVALVLSACTSGGSSGSGGSDSAPSAAPVIEISPAQGEKVAPDAEIVVTSAGGSLETINVAAADGTVVPGKLTDGNTIWRSDGGLLQFGGKYNVQASAVDGKVRTDAESTFAVKETKGLRAFVSPDKRTVGVGMPITVKLSATPRNRAAVERRLSVTTSKPVVGAWHWFSDTELHYRPKEFWPANTDVAVKAKLKGVKFGKNTFGDHNTSTSFRVGAEQISIVDIANYEMTVTKNGKVVRTIPVTNGEPGFTTRSGIKVIISKEESTVMDSTTIDIPEDSADAYRLTVKKAMRLTWSGEYIHAAPWSTSRQGSANVSHGCTGLSDANAAWMFDFSRVGDVVKYIGSNRPIEQGNGFTDWNMPWSEWLGGSALV